MAFRMGSKPFRCAAAKNPPESSPRRRSVVSQQQGPGARFRGSPLPSKPAPVVIDQVIADGLQIPAASGISLDPDNAEVEVHYGVVLLRSQERIRFRYMLEGFDKIWSDASPSRVAYYTNLPPGNYHFRVAAFEMNNPEQVAAASLEIVQKPHFYRTPWFLGCMVLLLAAAVWGVYQFRLGQLHGRFQAVLNERNRLAREMHDTLIQGCASVSALLEAHSSLAQNKSDGNGDLLGLRSHPVCAPPLKKRGRRCGACAACPRPALTSRLYWAKWRTSSATNSPCRWSSVFPALRSPLINRLCTKYSWWRARPCTTPSGMLNPVKSILPFPSRKRRAA